MAQTKIEWTATRLPDGMLAPGFTFNPWIGCEKVSAACKNCYAERDFSRKPRWADCWGPAMTTKRKRTSLDNWKKPYRWNRKAETDGVRYKVFCASLADVFEGHQDIRSGGWREQLWDLIVSTPHLDWLLLTKRPEYVRMMVPGSWMYKRWPKHVWMGVTAENQEMVDKRIPLLLDIPAAVRFVSVEPMLGPVVFPYRKAPKFSWLTRTGIDWVIAGGESGPHARPTHPDWFRSLRDQCVATGVPYFLKQHGEWIQQEEYPGDFSRVMWMDKNGKADYEPGEADTFWKVGRKAAGNLLDGQEWKQFPGDADD